MRTLVEGLPHLVWRSCDRGLRTWSSPQWLACTGQTQQGSHGRGWLNAVHPEDRRHAIAAWERAVQDGDLDVEFRVRRVSDGSWMWHRTTSLPARDEAGRVIGWLGSTTETQAFKDLQQRQQDLPAAAGRQVQVKAEIEQRHRVEAQLRSGSSDRAMPDQPRWAEQALAIVRAQIAGRRLVAVRDSAGRTFIGTPEEMAAHAWVRAAG